jgi:hypothetical protein
MVRAGILPAFYPERKSPLSAEGPFRFSTDPDPSKSYTVVENPLLGKVFPEEPLGSIPDAERREMDRRINYPTASWRKILLTQPPLASVVESRRCAWAPSDTHITIHRTKNSPEPDPSTMVCRPYRLQRRGRSWAPDARLLVKKAENPGIVMLDLMVEAAILNGRTYRVTFKRAPLEVTYAEKWVLWEEGAVTGAALPALLEVEEWK